MANSTRSTQRRTFYVRKFLNRIGFHGSAFILASVVTGVDRRKDSKTGELREHPWVNGTLQIADCHRSISLSIDDYSKADRENSLRKVDLLISTLTKFRTALAAAFARQDAGIARSRASRATRRLRLAQRRRQRQTE